MNYDEAVDSMVSLSEAKQELVQHGFRESEIRLYKGRIWICLDSISERVAKGKDGEFSGGDILDWLGY